MSDTRTPLQGVDGIDYHPLQRVRELGLLRVTGKQEGVLAYDVLSGV